VEAIETEEQQDWLSTIDEFATWSQIDVIGRGEDRKRKKVDSEIQEAQEAKMRRWRAVGIDSDEEEYWEAEAEEQQELLRQKEEVENWSQYAVICAGEDLMPPPVPALDSEIQEAQEARMRRWRAGTVHDSDEERECGEYRRKGVGGDGAFEAWRKETYGRRKDPSRHRPTRRHGDIWYMSGKQFPDTTKGRDGVRHELKRHAEREVFKEFRYMKTRLLPMGCWWVKLRQMEYWRERETDADYEARNIEEQAEGDREKEREREREREREYLGG
jgi:hypothetical protein